MQKNPMISKPEITNVRILFLWNDNYSLDYLYDQNVICDINSTELENIQRVEINMVY